MKCKSCKNSVPDGSIFCNFCGERLVKAKREKAREINVPKAKKLPSGTWFIEMQIEGERHSVSAKTEAECTAKARAIKAGLLDGAARAKNAVTLREMIDKHIDGKSRVLSPSTIRGYRGIQRNRFQSVMDRPLSSNINWKIIVNQEAELTSAKTLKNAWLFICSVLNEAKYPVPKVTLPLVPKADRPWLDHTQIPIFIEAVRGKPCEIVALLGLHGLRRSEIFGLRVSDIDLRSNTIRVSESVVMDATHQFVRKDTAKNKSSQRVVPIMIPALRTLLKETVAPRDDGPLLTSHPNAAYKQINCVCDELGFPRVGLHGLRHSFASLAHYLGLSEQETMEIGGWADHATMRNKYTHLSAVERAEAGNKLSAFFENPNETPNV